MNPRSKLALTTLLATAVCAATAWAAMHIVWAVLPDEVRPAVTASLAEHAGVLLLLGVLVAAFLGMAFNALIDSYVRGPMRLAEATRVIASTNPGHRITEGGSAENRQLIREINRLADSYGALSASVEARVAEATHALTSERDRLAALMAELKQAVVICNAEGQVLLYNRAASDLLGDSSVAGPLALGHSIFGTLNRHAIAFGVSRLSQRLDSGPAETPERLLVTIGSGRIVQVTMMAVVHQDPGQSTPALSGYVLTLDDPQRAVETAARRDNVMTALAVDLNRQLDAIATGIRGKDVATAEAAVAEARRTLSRASLRHGALSGDEPGVAPMMVTDVLAATRRHAQRHAGVTPEISECPVDAAVEVDGHGLVLVLNECISRLQHDGQASGITVGATVGGDAVEIHLNWQGSEIAHQTLTGWLTAPVDALVRGANSAQSFAVHHGGRWQHAAHSGRLTLMLPTCGASAGPAPNTAAGNSPDRPVFYDFDLFRTPAPDAALACALRDLRYTVFDTETTGLEPAAGDEIISIGAVRLLRMRVMHGESFEQLVDPGRALNPASIPIHGIRPEMLAGQPRITEVLPRFHAFCSSSVLVAHNAAFDMRFLELKEPVTGCRFDQPVLDTLLLAAVALPQLGTYRFETIAERLGVNVIGRHTALGDALVTAEIFVRLVPMLEAAGVRTLGDAIAAAEKTVYAKVRY